MPPPSADKRQKRENNYADKSQNSTNLAKINLTEIARSRRVGKE